MIHMRPRFSAAEEIISKTIKSSLGVNIYWMFDGVKSIAPNVKCTCFIKWWWAHCLSGFWNEKFSTHHCGCVQYAAAITACTQLYESRSFLPGSELLCICFFFWQKGTWIWKLKNEVPIWLNTKCLVRNTMLFDSHINVSWCGHRYICFYYPGGSL